MILFLVEIHLHFKIFIWFPSNCCQGDFFGTLCCFFCRLSYHFASFLWISLSFHLRHHSTSSSPTFGPCISGLSTSLFLENLIYFAFPFLLNLYSPGLLSDGYLWLWHCSAFSLRCQLHINSSSPHSSFNVSVGFILISVKIISCHQVETKHSKSAPFHTIIHSPHLIPFRFSFYSSHFYFN